MTSPCQTIGQSKHRLIVVNSKNRSASEVIRDSLRWFKEREAQLADLRAEIDRGLHDIEQGDVEELSMEKSMWFSILLKKIASSFAFYIQPAMSKQPFKFKVAIKAAAVN